MWPDDVEEMVYVLVRSELIKQRRKRAASSLTRYALARLTRRWFLAIRTPWRLQGSTLLWPHAAAMHVPPAYYITSGGTCVSNRAHFLFVMVPILLACGHSRAGRGRGCGERRSAWGN